MKRIESIAASRARRSRIVAALLSIGLAVPAVATADGEPVVAGHRFTIDSRILGEARTYSVHLPRSYADSERHFPVLYLTDGEWNFLQTVGLVDQLSRWARIPETIVVAIENTERTRDLTPVEDGSFPGSGGAPTFLAFLETELIPEFERAHRTTGFRTLWGHSFGGVFAFYALTQTPDLFDAYVSAGASLWLQDDWIFARMDSLVRARPDLERYLYFTAGEGDGGPTLPRNLAMRDWLEANAPPGLEWHYATTTKENHHSNVPITLQQGLQELYPIWGMDRELHERAVAEGPDGVRAWLEERKDRWGARFAITEFEIYVVGRRLLVAGKIPESIAVFDLVIEHFPNSGQPWSGKGLAFEAREEYAEAARMFERALEIGREHGEPSRHLWWYEHHLARVREKLAES